MTACKSGREEERQNLLGEDDVDLKRVEVAPTAKREREIPGQLTVQQREEKGGERDVCMDYIRTTYQKNEHPDTHNKKHNCN